MKLDFLSRITTKIDLFWRIFFRKKLRELYVPYPHSSFSCKYFTTYWFWSAKYTFPLLWTRRTHGKLQQYDKNAKSIKKKTIGLSACRRQSLSFLLTFGFLFRGSVEKSYLYRSRWRIHHVSLSLAFFPLSASVSSGNLKFATLKFPGMRFFTDY